MKHKVVVEYEYPVEHKTPVKAELILHGDSVETWDVKPLKQGPKWIPVDERLPQESKMFLVTLVDKEDDYVCIDVAWYAHPNDYSIEFGEWREVPTGEKVIAWMQLPEPYKEGNEE